MASSTKNNGSKRDPQSYRVSLSSLEGEGADIGDIPRWDGSKYVPQPVGGGNFRFFAEAQISYSLSGFAGEDNQYAYLGSGANVPPGVFVLVTDQDETPNGWYESLEGEGVYLRLVTDITPFDGSHNGDTIWVNKRYESEHDPGAGPWLYGIYSSEEVAFALVELSAPVSRRPATLTANCILAAPSLNPEPGDTIWTVFYDGSIESTTTAVPEENRPEMPPFYSLFSDETWTGVWDNAIGARVALMLPGDANPRGIYWVTQDGFQKISMNAGTSVSVFCSNIVAGFNNISAPMKFTAIGGEVWPFGGSDGDSDSFQLVPDFMTSH